MTGVCGFNGLYMAELLIKSGYAVRGTDLPDVDRACFAHLDIEFISADLTKPGTLDVVLRDVDVVFHPASIFDYLPSLDKMRRVNVEGTRNLLNAMKNNGVARILHWSTVDVYGDPDARIYAHYRGPPQKSKKRISEIKMGTGTIGC